MLPIVLAHGYLGFSTLGFADYFNHILPLYTQLGAHQVFATQVPARGSILERSQELAIQIRQNVPSGKVHIIAHSMGGLDARYLAAQQQGKDLIATLTTLGSPFQGTFAADVAVDPLRVTQLQLGELIRTLASYQLHSLKLLPSLAAGDLQFAVGELLKALEMALLGDYSHVGNYFAGLFSLPDAAVHELTTERCKLLFPTDESDLAGVPTFSYAGLIEPARVTPVLAASAILLTAMGEANDGIVPLRSAMLKNHKGDLAVDHLGLVGWGTIDVSTTYRQIFASLETVV